MKNRMAFTPHSFLLRLALSIAMILVVALASRAGGPKCVAGSSYFDPTSAGQPLVWQQGVITYYTDQGDLSPLMPNASANNFVADAFAQWTSVPTAALAATNGGPLAEDVNGSNVLLNSDATITMPADIQPTATGTPIGVVYDDDGSVTDALMGMGAGDSSQCFSNAVFGGNDSYGNARELPACAHCDEWPVRAAGIATCRLGTSTGPGDRWRVGARVFFATLSTPKP
jgi:hypothetical protein